MEDNKNREPLTFGPLAFIKSQMGNTPHSVLHSIFIRFFYITSSPALSYSYLACKLLLLADRGITTIIKSECLCLTHMIVAL